MGCEALQNCVITMTGMHWSVLVTLHVILPNLHFIPAHSSLITAQMDSAIPPILGSDINSILPESM